MSQTSVGDHTLVDMHVAALVYDLKPESQMNEIDSPVVYILFDVS